MRKLAITLLVSVAVVIGVLLLSWHSNQQAEDAFSDFSCENNSTSRYNDALGREQEPCTGPWMDGDN